jgi:hypothetical protein
MLSRISTLLSAIVTLWASLLAQEVPAARVVATVSETPLVAEAVAYDAKTHTYLLSSINKRAILALKDERMRTFVEPQAGSLTGIALDPASRILWACSLVSKLGKEYMLSAEKEHSEVLAIDMDAAKVRRIVQFPEPEKPHFCDSVAVSANGELFITDSGMNAICILPKGAPAITKCVETYGRIFPQGVVPLKSTKALVAGYAAGIGELDFAAETWRKLKAPPDADLRGIDGLTGYKNCLIGIQNGGKPAKILLMHLNTRQDAIDTVVAVKTDPSELDEPTWGTVVDDRFVFIGNSQNETFRAKGASAVKPTMLLEFPLPASCAK